MIFKSSNQFLKTSFDWAVNKAKTFVVTDNFGPVNMGEGNKWYGPDGVVLNQATQPWAMPQKYKPCYWAGYYDRTAYYLRDFVHQAQGAHYLGLQQENFNMFFTFVSNACEKTGWFAPWAFNFDNSIYYMDTPNYKSFVREITAQFELVETAYVLYCLTGDKRYIADESVLNFIEKTMSVFIDNLDGVVLPEKNGIPEGFGDIFKITATYNESGFKAVEAADSIAAMYKAIVAYSNILSQLGKSEQALQQMNRAVKLKDYFNNQWSVVDDSDMYAFAVDKNGKKYCNWQKNGHSIIGGETLFFIALKQLAHPGARCEKLLDYIDTCQQDLSLKTTNIESLTYLPDLFFYNGRTQQAWYWMQYIFSQKDLPHEHVTQGLNGDYPEISFTYVSQVINGILGISFNAGKGEITVNPQLPLQVDDASILDLKFGDYTVDVLVDKKCVTVNNHSQKPIVWLVNGDACIIESNKTKKMQRL